MVRFKKRTNISMMLGYGSLGKSRDRRRDLGRNVREGKLGGIWVRRYCDKRRWRRRIKIGH